MLGKDTISQPQNWQMVLELKASELIVMLFSSRESHSMIVERIPLQGSAPWHLPAIEDAIYDNPLLLADFARTIVLIDSVRFLPMSVETSAVAEAAVTDEMQRAFSSVYPPLGRDAELVSCPLTRPDATLVMETPRDVLHFLRRTFHNAAISHPLVPLAKYFCRRNTVRPAGKTLASLNDRRLDLIILGANGAPAEINTFHCPQPIDAFYYIMASRHHLHAPSNAEILIAGDRNTRATLSPMLRRYVRYVMPAIFPTVMFTAGRASLAAPFEMVVAPLTI